MVQFIMVDQSSEYNSILWRLTLYAIKATTYVYHYIMKFPMKVSIWLSEEIRKRPDNDKILPLKKEKSYFKSQVLTLE